MSAQATFVQRDWENRELVEEISSAVKRIASFLTTFDSSTRYRLAALNEKLSQLERQVDYLDARVVNVDAANS
ncbi:hypothetical protein CAOG_05826 [Capsaspora owczarzaki ATCC 30864]|uniref:BRICK1 protein n=1 Tax=Capsaspora owczarzaki (strain ATCC 30864) TaxID=595528 RepID=A0A0D2WU52_CAPO3|nr:hypothetical protein CAOG_05826 [Capsaspora owczarzaki ATCC 30864]KJE95373.1 hypothetical protein CAOG_005826 [Capsaspora owczarzaki ATCC 30864]|eukprot:XP_004345416.1 hypothetical protein CAOG_05826 [Capsaspora owczarzaki ATCC 30864]